MSIQPRLNRFDLSMIVISLVIGMGIFGSPSDVAVKAGSAPVFFGAWIFGGIVTLCGALTFAEIGARYPTTGGFYKVFSYCYHPAFAFMINWVLVISNASSVAAVALLGAEYINPILLPPSLQNSTGSKLTTILTVLLLYVINFLGIKLSARAQNVLTIFKVVAIVVLCTAIFKSDAEPKTLIAVVPHTGSVITAFGLSLVAVFFTYGGYQQTINFGGDIINAKKNIPKAIFFGIGTVIALYLAINYVYYSVLGIGGLQQTHTLAAKLAGVIFGATGYKITSILMFVSVLAYVNVNILANPRVYYAMAEDGMLPPIFKKVNPKTQVQEFGMTVFVAAALIILFFVGSFSAMLKYVMFFDTIGLSLCALTIFILRKKTKHLDTKDIYVIKWFPLIPAIFILAYWFVTINIFITFKEDPFAAFWCLAAYALGLAIYYIGKRKQSPALP
ncbi:APC family permease [Mucilaginibacter phyllosphaerae]|uniref:APA family basic amino acid/polyamine antiporter n=1 Tax=Mucilaginibacter phyllosphaerae TaxID=1812349 RepID=A0A4Y8AMA5_9SPHI|nr:APC family permease [Mucilaginibacter phyllosphaerae]MBB3967478.1 APA family basic amino acid/polyamine antiporter [Mucilaginibacter phyllosphaerae]TEW69455.1 APC family permease [Mucilaginibacter phyllosphaerae]GGH20953.1 amino acid permease [Mucilaginibacter phyllosphaerae]